MPPIVSPPRSLNVRPTLEGMFVSKSMLRLNLRFLNTISLAVLCLLPIALFVDQTVDQTWEGVAILGSGFIAALYMFYNPLISARITPLVQLTPQQVIFPEGRFLLEELAEISLHHMQIRIARRDGSYRFVLDDISQEEFAWLRSRIADHIRLRRQQMGPVGDAPTQVPETLLALRRQQ